MAMQNTILSQKLWEMKKYRSIVINSNDEEISKDGHGIFVQSNSGDTYADLRPCSVKPFWGHSHPILIKYQNTQALSVTKQDFNFECVEFNHFTKSLEENYNSIKKYNFTDNLGAIPKNSDLLSIEIDETFLSLTKEEISKKTERINSLSSSTDILIIESYLLLVNPKDLSFAKDLGIKCHHLLIKCLPGFDTHLFKSKTISMAKPEPIVRLYFDLYNFYLLALNPASHSKFKINTNFIKTFIQENSLIWEIHYNYLTLPSPSPQIQQQFLAAGLLICEENLMNEVLFLSIPSSCTKNELLDILHRIKDLVIEE